MQTNTTTEQLQWIIPPAPAEPIYLIPQAAKVMGCGERTLIGKIKAGEIRAKKKLRKWYLLHSDLVAYINS